MLRSSVSTAVIVLLGLVASAPTGAQTSFTILHTNDFQGQLELAGSNPGAARVAAVINGVRTAVGTDNVLLVDGGDVMQGSLLSNLQKGLPAIDYYRTIGYDVATLGNHDFDWGQTVLAQRVAQAGAAATADSQPFPFLAANVVSGSCDPGNWTSPAFAKPYEIVQVASGAVRVAFIGVTTVETPSFVPPEATAGLCFKDPAEAVVHYYDEVKAQADVVVVLSHLGYYDGGYGYGLPVYGDQTLAVKLINAGKPVPLIIGGHSHTNMTDARVITVAGKAGQTYVTQAYYAGRRVGRADITVGGGGDPTVSWQDLSVLTTGPQDPLVADLVASYVNDPAYLALINQPIFYAQVDLLRNYNGESMMGSLVADGVYGALNSDSSTANDVDVFLSNPGGLRTDWCYESGAWSSLAAHCEPGVWPYPPMLLNWGQMFTVLPFGNSVVIGNLTGAKILEALDQSATLFKGALQPAGLRYKFTQSPTPYAFDVCVVNRTSAECEPLNPSATYRVATLDFLFGGGDGFMGFRSMTDVTFWGDMLDLFNAWAAANHGGSNPYLGPNGDGTLDGRIVLSASGDVVPPVVTVSSPVSTTYTRSTPIVIRFTATDPGTGVRELVATLDGATVTNGLALDMVALPVGSHTLRVVATDGASNTATVTVAFVLGVTVDSLTGTTQQLYSLGQIDSKGVLTSLLAKLKYAKALILSGNVAGAKAALQTFIAAVQAQSGKHISSSAATLMVGDANWLLAQL
jgi:2',3'-cyclic-nucleotide 2'-phosphodiesterase (5'-nucleotidase family)